MKNDDLSGRGSRLREERKRLGINTQDELAEMIGVKKNTIVRFERHNDAMNTDQLDKLEDCGFDIGYILWGKRSNLDVTMTHDEEKLLSIFRELDDAAKAGLLVIAETYAQQSKK